MRANDQRGDNEKTSEATVSVVISRDQQPPQFVGAPFDVEVSENRGVNESVVRITASDPDLQGKLQYQIRGVAPGSDYFWIDKDEGIVYVKQPLNTETATSYTVSTLELWCYLAYNSIISCSDGDRVCNIHGSNSHAK